jgi:hypothetical protein
MVPPDDVGDSKEYKCGARLDHIAGEVDTVLGSEMRELKNRKRRGKGRREKGS